MYFNYYQVIKEKYSITQVTSGFETKPFGLAN